jgi:hypothetical protein
MNWRNRSAVNEQSSRFRQEMALTVNVQFAVERFVSWFSTIFNELGINQKSFKSK